MAGITAATNYQYRVIITNCSGGSTITSNAATLAVNALPSVTFTGTLAAQCITSTTYALTGGAPAGGSYSGPGVSGANFNASVAGAGSHTITYTYTDGNGCINSATNTIAVDDIPVITNQTTSILSGGTFNVTPGGAPVGHNLYLACSNIYRRSNRWQRTGCTADKYLRDTYSAFRIRYCYLYCHSNFRSLYRNYIYSNRNC